MNRRRFFAATSCLVATSTAVSAEQPSADEAVRQIIERYVDAREASDAKAIEPLFTPDADQLVSDGTWRRGRDELVRGMLESSRRNPARRSITIESVRMLSELVKESDGRFQIANYEFINTFEIRLYIHSQFGICHPESISSRPLSRGGPGRWSIHSEVPGRRQGP